METSLRRISHTELIRTKLLAMLCLRRALLEERYEECALHLEEALRYGAAPEEIARLLRMPGTHPEETG